MGQFFTLFLRDKFGDAQLHLILLILYLYFHDCFDPHQVPLLIIIERVVAEFRSQLNVAEVKYFVLFYF